MKPLYLLLCCLMAVGAVAQEIEYVDRKAKPETKKKAFAMIVSTQVNDTCWEKGYYKKNGPCFLSIRYKDRTEAVQHGRYVRFGKDGCADTVGYYANGKKEGRWIVPGDNCLTLYILEYANDKLISVQDSTQFGMERKKWKDSLLALNPPDTTEIDSEFPGGPRGWQQYLNRNLRYPAEAIDDEVMGQVNVAFIVKPDGNIEDPFIWKSADYYLDKESLRIIIKSQLWEPARLFGKKIRSYKIQPVVYRLEYGK
jgi:periplasmic protein TonB